ncbi:MAG: hypothetical protein QG635_696 [Bacteroidota bacterium]|nr:hypothetical protein [Bacteroidota bacterium]
MDLKTKYLGMTLRSPIIASASPLSESLDNIKKMEDSGAGAVVLFSLFEEQIKQEQIHLFAATTQAADISAESLNFFPNHDDYRLGSEDYLELISKAKAAVKIPVIASLNGISTGGWISYAHKMQDAGADALELNIYNIPTDINMSGEEYEKSYIEVVKAVKSSVTIPVAVKLSPFFSNMANMAYKLDNAGADGLVLFNRFYQPDIDLDELVVKPNVVLSHSIANRLPMRWVALLKGRIHCDLAATSGVHSGADAIKLIMAGANVVGVCSAILKHGIGYIKTLEEEMVKWMTEKEYVSVEQMLGSMSQLKTANPSSYERAQYMKALTSYRL